MSISNPLLNATQQFAEALRRVEPLAAYYQALTDFEFSADARLLMRQYSEAQQKVRLQSANPTHADITRLRELYQQVTNDAIIMAYHSSQREATAYLRLINDELSQLLGMDFSALAGSG
ncbi:MAG: YlbF family regulator, partial [Anaerolineae bacterium]|nr:YlbF family regulator [Anaerolineae bacterium]